MKRLAFLALFALAGCGRLEERRDLPVEQRLRWECGVSAQTGMTEATLKIMLHGAYTYEVRPTFVEASTGDGVFPTSPLREDVTKAVVLICKGRRVFAHSKSPRFAF